MARYSLINEPKAPETGLQVSGRQIARTVARTGEAALGTPGDVLSSLLSLGQMGAQKIRDIGIPTQLLGTPAELLESAAPAFESLKNYIPTSETIKKYGTENIEKLLPEGFLKAQNEYENTSDNIIKDFIGFIHPVMGPLKIGSKAAAAISGAGNIASFATKKLGFGEGAQEAVKAGTMLLTSLLGEPSLIQEAEKLYTTSEAATPKGAFWSGNRIKLGLKKSNTKLSRLHEKSFGSIETEARGILDGLNDIIVNNQGVIPLESLKAYDQRISRMLYKSSKIEKEAAREYLLPIKESLKKTIADAGNKYPEYANSLLAANELYSGLKTGASAESFLNNIVKKGTITDPKTQAILGLSYAAGSTKTGALINSIRGLSNGISKAYDVIKSSPEVQKYYIQTMNSALRKNASATLRNARLLDQAVQKENKKESAGRYKLID